MNSTTVLNTTLVTAEPVHDIVGKRTELEQLYILHYRQHGNPGLQKIFKFDGNVYEARDFAMQYCIALNLRLLYVSPFLSDFTEELRRRNPVQVEGAMPGPPAVAVKGN